MPLKHTFTSFMFKLQALGGQGKCKMPIREIKDYLCSFTRWYIYISVWIHLTLLYSLIDNNNLQYTSIIKFLWIIQDVSYGYKGENIQEMQVKDG